ncbi:adenylate kinase [Albimonas sp. CAU 1670]|uniref:AAA family ATPase n=1 Tax=Albimonas sp. CAU 1670 TaxID=3032599 RepID=UPI0023DBDF9E|nr:adenylate kinase [Albimonas sp. CAU 1670]MDF2232782.1 adenylate kinase [Albimonas sp. CAU 1670]
MRKPRLHLTGASCSGVSTLAAELAARLGVPQIDVDDHYWLPTDPPYTEKRPPEGRVALIQARQAAADGWVLAGSLLGWGDALVEGVDLIVFLDTPTPVRLRRLDRREAERHGARIRPGGDMHEAHLAFRDWASRYDDPNFSGRNRAGHERWLGARSAPVLRLTGEGPVEALADRVQAEGRWGA